MALVSDDDLYRELSRRGVWRHNDDWWGATPRALTQFSEDEVVEKRAADDTTG